MNYEAGGSLPIAMQASPSRSISKDVAAQIPGMDQTISPASDYLCLKSGLAASLRNSLLEDADFFDMFDRFEYFLGLVYWDLSDQLMTSSWAPNGRFVWRNNPSRMPDSMQPVQRLRIEIEAMGNEWRPLRAGFFNGSLDRLNIVMSAYHALLERTRY